MAWNIDPVTPAELEAILVALDVRLSSGSLPQGGRITIDAERGTVTIPYRDNFGSGSFVIRKLSIEDFSRAPKRIDPRNEWGVLKFHEHGSSGFAPFHAAETWAEIVQNLAENWRKLVYPSSSD